MDRRLYARNYCPSGISNRPQKVAVLTWPKAPSTAKTESRHPDVRFRNLLRYSRGLESLRSSPRKNPHFQNDSRSANCITRGVKPMLVDVIWPNELALVGTPSGLRLTVQPDMAEFGSEKFGVLVIL